MTWITVGPVDDVVRQKKVVVDVDGYEVLVLAHDGALYAFQNHCIHKQRELARGVVLNGKLVCPSHQWAFALGSGHEAVKDQCQPTYEVRVVDGTVEVDVERPPADIVAVVDTPVVVAAVEAPVEVTATADGAPCA